MRPSGEALKWVRVEVAAAALYLVGILGGVIVGTLAAHGYAPRRVAASVALAGVVSAVALSMGFSDGTPWALGFANTDTQPDDVLAYTGAARAWLLTRTLTLPYFFMAGVGYALSKWRSVHDDQQHV